MYGERRLQKTYAWRRFWAREDTELLLEDNSYLPDPKHDFAQFLNPGFATLEKVCEEPCAILLGEPGMGKSRSLQADFDELARAWALANDVWALIDISAVTGLTDLQTLLMNDPRVVSWLGGSGILHLGLDSLDEALPTYGSQDHRGAGGGAEFGARESRDRPRSRGVDGVEEAGRLLLGRLRGRSSVVFASPKGY
jgi:hypothetical protein